MMADSFLLAVGNDTLSKGTAIALVGLVIVFTALILISLFIASLPKLLAVVAKVWPEVSDGHAGEVHPESLIPDDDKVLAAIGFVLHSEFQRQLMSDPSADKK